MKCDRLCDLPLSLVILDVLVQLDKPYWRQHMRETRLERARPEAADPKSVTGPNSGGSPPRSPSATRMEPHGSARNRTGRTTSGATCLGTEVPVSPRGTA